MQKISLYESGLIDMKLFTVGPVEMHDNILEMGVFRSDEKYREELKKSIKCK